MKIVNLKNQIHKKINIMEDSIELSGSDGDPQEINFFVSPQQSHAKDKEQRPLQHTASQQSLAYSNSTHQFNIRTERSPIDIPTVNFDSSRKSDELKKMLRAAKTKLSLPENQCTSLGYGVVSLANQMSPPARIYREERKKTVNKAQGLALSKKNKELEYALQSQIITSEELRAKVGVLSQLLEQQLKSSELAYLLGLKNSSKNMKNIDIFVELKQCQNKLKEKALIISQQKQEIQELKENRIVRSTDKKLLSIIKKQENQEEGCQNEICILQEEKESLFQYIEQLENRHKCTIQRVEELEKEIEHCQQKQQKFITIERPKLIHEIQERTQKIQQLQQQQDRNKMEFNLQLLKYQMEAEERKNDVHQGKVQKKDVSIICKEDYRTVQTQTDETDKRGLMKAELDILKNQRNHYIEQYRKKVSQCGQVHSLRLQVKVLQNQLNKLIS